MSNEKIHFTNHVLQRFKERFHNECKNKTDGEIKSQVYNMISESMPDRSFLNNSRYMLKLYEKYGYDLKFEFLVSGNVVFVSKLERNRKIILTCYGINNSVFSKKVKFKKHDKNNEIVID